MANHTQFAARSPRFSMLRAKWVDPQAEAGKRRLEEGAL